MSMGKGGSSSQVTGYRYFMAVHQGLCRGPVNALTEIRVGDIPAWTGNLTASNFFDIDKPSLFGGDQKEGGVDGIARLLMGEPTQTIPSIITNNIEGDFPVPGWRGVTTVFYYGLISSNNPYPKPWKFKVNRTTAGWDTAVWRPDLATVVMQSTPLTLISFNSNPNPGDNLNIGDYNIQFLPSPGPPMPFTIYVNIGSEAEDTANNFASQVNFNSSTLYNVVATSAGKTVQLLFPNSVSVYVNRGNFASISNTGGSINAMNGAHILYECVTNNVWGRGLPTSFIDETSFLIAAQTLFNEGFGLCMKWTRQDDIDRFVSLVLQHIGGALFINRRTGLVTLKLLRSDYDPDLLDAFTFENGLLDVVEDESSSNDTTFNEIIVNYIDPISGNQGSMRTQNLASFQAIGTLISTTTDYLGLPTAALAARVSQRDLQINSGEVRRFKIKFDRVAWYISPGDVFKISVPSRGISNMILRAGAIEDGPLEDETITITAMQDIFSLPESSFVTPQPSFWTPPDRSVRVIDERLVDELTYFDLAENIPTAELDAITADSGIIKVYAVQPTGFTVDYIIASKTSLETDYVERTIAGFDAGAELASPLTLHATMGAVESISSVGFIVSVPILALLVSESYQEYVELTAIDIETGAITITRGCIDTVPHTFVVGDKIWFQTDMPTSDFVDRSTGEIVNVKLLSRTTSEKLSQGLAPTDTVEIGGRQGRPYPPGNLRINGSPFQLSQVAEGDIVFTWAHRDRIVQGNFIVGHTTGDTGPEPGTTYTVRVYDDLSLLRTVSGISGTTWTYTELMQAEDGSLPIYRFEIESIRDGLVSWQKYDLQILIAEDIGFNESFDYNFDGSPATRTTEDGDVRVTESGTDIRVTES